MQKKHLLLMLLMALFVPLAVNAQEAIKANRPLQFNPERGLLEMNGTNGTNRGDRETTYELVTASQTDWSGNYVLVGPWNTTTGYAFSGTISNNQGGITAVTIDGNSLSSIGDAPVLTIAKSTVNADYYSIRINGGDYLSDGTSGLETSSTETEYYWQITYTSNGMQIYCPRWNGGPYYLYFVVYQNTSTSNYGALYATCQEGDFDDIEGYTFEYDFPVLYKETTSGGGQGGDNYVWVETTTITPNEEYLIGFSNGSDVYLAVSYYTGGTGNSAYYENISSSYYGYVAKASFDGNGYVTGVSGYATDLQYCTWKFSTNSGGTIQATYNNYYLNTWSSTSYADLYPANNSNNGTGWTYASGKLYRTISNTNRYAIYSTQNSNPHMCVTSTNPSSANVKLYTKQLVETGYAVNASSSISNGSIQFSTNGGVNWYDNLSNVPAGETVVISVQPETGYELSGTPTVTPTCSVTGSGNLYSFVMPESDVTVNATFNCIAPADPTFSVAAGTYTTVQNVSISCATAGATIYYTTDGSTPTNSSTQYTGAITINSTTTLKAIAYNGSCTSNVTTATYTMDLPTYTVTCATGLTGGSIAANPASAVEGSTITITATTESGWFLGTLTVTDANNHDVPVTINGNTGTFTMPASNVTVTATFTQGFQVTLNQTPNGTVSADQTTGLHPGDVVTLTATPDNGCVFLAWYAYKDGDPRDVIALVNNSWFFMPSSNVTVQAVFVTEEEHEQTVGGGSNTSNYLPTNVYYNYSLTQQIYTATEIGYNGRITAIAFKALANISDPRTLDIYMAHTSKTAFTSTTDWQTMGPSFLVYSGNVNFANNDWTTITLETPFEYDGTSNLNICVVDRTGGYESNSRAFSTYGTNANRALYIYDDDTDFSEKVNASGITDYSGTQYTSNNQIKFTIKVPGSAESLTISPDAISDFSYLEDQGPSETHKLDIVGVDLENNITITAPTNFEVCLTEDGTYTSSLTIPRETSKGNRTATTWDFDSGLDGWTAIDEDGDGYNWEQSTTFEAYNESNGCVVSASYDNNVGPLTPNNWLISPQVELGGTFSLYAVAQDQAWPQEHFGIYVSTDGESFTLMGEWTLSAGDWRQYSIDLRAYAGQNGYIAVRHFNCTDKYYIKVDHFVLDTDAHIEIEMPVTITPATVFVRMKDNLNAGTYNGTLTASAGTGDNLNGSVSLSGEVIAAYNITLTANPTEGGAVAGAGSYPVGTEVTVSARTNSPYTFINWTENGTVVSTNASYTFTVNANRALVANFGLTKEITAYTGDYDHWYLIASPVTEPITPSADNGFLTNEFDLYKFDQTQDLEWRNYEEGAFDITNGTGYLYASQTNTTLVFTGTPYSGNGQITLTRGSNPNDPKMVGWNLIGNPFPTTANFSEGFYKLNSDCTEFIASSAPVEAMEGILAYTDTDGRTVSFSTSASKHVSRLAINLSKGRGVIDRAIVNFEEGRMLPKFQLNRNNTKVYIQQEGQDYAVVNAEENMGELPVSFRAKENGTYSLSINAEDVSFGYLHLIDNMTGTDVDLLATPSYTFEANITDYASRFRLVYATGTADDDFAFFSNGSFVINNEGDAMLQVIDVNGRIIRSESINGCANVNLNAASGVYMLRLINGNDMKTQKVVVR